MVKLTTKKIESEFFKLEEFIKSPTAKRLNISNEPNEEIVRNLQYGVSMILDPARRMLGTPIIITSGYRCQKLNQAVGGVQTSWHQKGNAADIHIASKKEAERIFDVLKRIPSVDTVLFEHTKTSQWIHVQWDMMKTPRHHFNFNYIPK